MFEIIENRGKIKFKRSCLVFVYFFNNYFGKEINNGGRL